MVRAKTDKADSKLLVEYGKHFEPKLWKPKDDCYVELQQLLNLQSQLVKQETMVKNQLEAIEHSVARNEFAQRKLQEQLNQIQIDLNPDSAIEKSIIFA